MTQTLIENTASASVKKSQAQEAIEALVPHLTEAQEFKRRPPVCAPNNWASKMGHICERYLYYIRVDGDKATKKDWKGIADRGNVMADWWKREMIGKGFKVIHDQLPLSDKLTKQYKISGRIDGRVGKGEIRPLLYEFKSMNDWAYKSINDWNDFSESKSWWVRGYPAQIQLYLLDQNEEGGLMVLMNAQTWEWKVIPVYLDLGYCEYLLNRAERVNKAVNSENAPERIGYDSKICGQCEFAHICLPDIKNEGWEFRDDEKLSAILKERASLEESADRFDELDKEAKEIAKVAGKTFLLPKWKVEIKKVTMTRLDTKSIPIEVRTKYEVETETTKVSFIPLGEIK